VTRYDHLSPVPGSPVPGQPPVPAEYDRIGAYDHDDLDRGEQEDRESTQPLTARDHLQVLGQRAKFLLRAVPRAWRFWAFLVFAGGTSLFAIVAVITGLANAADGFDPDAPWASHLPDWPLTSTITGPVNTTLATYAQGLPLSANSIGWLWLLSAAAFFVLAAAGAFGARIGWILTGVLTTAAVVAGSPLHNAAVAGGVTVLVWALLSLIALRRLPTGGPEVVVVPPAPSNGVHPDRDRDDDRDRDASLV
jgi:hypothetical protein